MTDPRALDALREMFRGVNERIGAVAVEDQPAAAVFERFDGSGGNVRTLEEPDVRHEPVRDVLAWDDPWPVSYGVDASTATPLQFSDGVLLSAANAKLGVKGNTDDPAVVHESTVSMSVYARDDDLDVGGLDGSGEHVERSVFRFPTLDGREDSLPGWTMSLARTFAEGAHTRRLVERIDGPLFIDGPVYPSGIVLWTLFAQNESAPRSPASDDICPARVVEILTNYVRVVEHHHREGYPVIGVTKQPGGSRTVGAIEREMADAPLRWGTTISSSATLCIRQPIDVATMARSLATPRGSSKSGWKHTGSHSSRSRISTDSHSGAATPRSTSVRSSTFAFRSGMSFFVSMHHC